MTTEPIADDFLDDLGAIARELFGADTKQTRRKVRYQANEAPREQRLKGIFKLGSKTCCLRSVLRADLARRAGLSEGADQREAQRQLAAEAASND
jgi:hypothetical protein